VQKIYTHGKEYKLRPVELVLKKLLELQGLRKKFIETIYKPWYDEGQAIGSFWGRERNSNKNLAGPQIVFEFSDQGYSHSSIEGHLYLQALVAKDDAIPLMVHDPKWKKVLSVLEDRLKGTLKPIVQRQDLITRHQNFTIRERHIGLVKGCYKELLYDILRNKYYEQVYSTRTTQNKLLILKSNGHDFYIQLENCNPRLLDDSEIFSVIVEPHEKNSKV